MPTAGKLMTNMQAIGIRPESVTKIVYTHAHPDHIWGTLDDFDEEPNFPTPAMSSRPLSGTSGWPTTSH